MEEMKKHNNPSMGPLPIDIIFNILSRLPVKYVLRSKSVCKSWYALIRSKQFVNHHLCLNSVSSSSYLSRNLLILSSKHDYSLYSLTFDTLKFSATKLSFFNDDGSSFSGFGGSCNGLLLCFCNNNGDSDHTDGSNSDICLVNPSTLKYKMMPKLKVPKNFLCVNYGFGYDHKFDDYKVVRVVNFVYGCDDGSVFNAREVMVYSLKTNSWKFIEEKVSNYATLASRNGALINNHLLHWVFWCISTNDHRISSFNVCNEQWSEVPMPNYGENRFGNHTRRPLHNGESKKFDVVHLGVLDGCLCLLTRNFRNDFNDVDVWVMNEYGVKKSWLKLLNVSDLNVSRPLNVVPIDCSKDEILFTTENELSIFRYNIRTKRSSSVEYYGFQDYCGVSACIRSIVPLDSYGENDG